MKNLIICSGIAIVLVASSANTSFDAKKNVETSKELRKEIIVSKNYKSEFSNSKMLSTTNNATAFKSNTLFLRNFPKTKMNMTIAGEEPIGLITTDKMIKTADQLIAEDNAITENNISNEIQPLDFDFINSITLNNEVVEPLPKAKAEKTANELIAQDNLITDSNLSNITEPLDFELINRISKS
jgi:hypothetical protein